MQYDFSDFDDGKEFINPSHLYTLDLDVFGEHSLFQYINRTATPIGKQHLANWFNAHLENKAAIDHRQEAIRELSTDLEYRQQIRLLGLLYKGNLPIPPKSKNGQPVRVIIENVRSCVSSQ